MGCALFVGALIAAPAASGAAGDLKPLGCLERTGAPDDCVRSARGLDGAADITVAPNGRSVYVAAFDDDAIVRLKRNPRDGSLRAGECIDDPATGPDLCGASEDGLEGASNLALSANGRDLYTIAYNDSTLLHFKANRAGALRLAHCVDDAGLAPVDDVCGDGTEGADGLGGPSGLALSRNGRWLYVSSQLDSALVQFRLNRRGKPVWRDCIEDDDKTLFDDCERNLEGLDDAGDVVVGRDGRSVYVASSSDSAISRFRANAESGELAYKGCVENRTPDGPDNCARSVEGIREVYSLGLSPDGRFLYSGSLNFASMGVFGVTRAGNLKPRGCVEGPFSAALCGTVAQGIVRSSDFAFDSRGRSLYVVGGRLQPFKRAPGSGELTERPCIEDDDIPTAGNSCSREAQGLGGVGDVAVSPDDRFVYSSAPGIPASADNAIAIFRRAR
jgi:6-phosphogluconolactonase (cycloisomerase 2 family)